MGTEYQGCEITMTRVTSSDQRGFVFTLEDLVYD